MAMLAELRSPENLRRAWRWLRSNPDASYKGYFRDFYAIYAIADTRLLDGLRDRLRRNLFEPQRACKLYFPKASGILRPYSLLTIEDQIVFQAAVNLVAERLFPKVRHRYNTEVFGHLYAGKTSTWFYRKWSDGYKAFNDAARKAFSGGYRVTASFDLTACYDSLDHGVLRHMLHKIGCDNEFCNLLTDWLSIWTATDRKIYHNHGIPQGPLGSGLLSETVLRYFDDDRRDQRRVRYFRYVDDIRLFAKSERDLRRMLVRLDMLSKDIGLFPQTGKISIHHVQDIEAELKTISHPTESSVKHKAVNQPRLRQRIVTLTPRFRIQHPTRFKYLLAHASPNAKLTTRLWRILENHPDIYSSVASYFRKYRRIPAKMAMRLVQEIERQELYPAVRAAFLSASEGRLAPNYERRLASLVKNKLWHPRNLSADLFSSAGRLLVQATRLSVAQTAYALRRERPWWGRARLVQAMSPQNTAGTVLAQTLNECLRTYNSEVSLASAFAVWEFGIAIKGSRASINPVAAQVLRELGVIARTPPPPCGIHASFVRLLGKAPTINWKRVFGTDYATVESHCVFARALADTNVSAWVNVMDVFDDWLLQALYAKDTTLGTYHLGSIGNVLNGGRLQRQYPAIYELAESVHTKRLESVLSHPRTRRTGKPTRPIRYAYLASAKRLIRKALTEIAAIW